MSGGHLEGGDGDQVGGDILEEGWELKVEIINIIIGINNAL